MECANSTVLAPGAEGDSDTQMNVMAGDRVWRLRLLAKSDYPT